MPDDEIGYNTKTPAEILELMVMFFTLDIVFGGGVVYAGVAMLKRHRKQEKMIWLANDGTRQQKPEALPRAEAFLIESSERIDHEFAISSLSLGISILGSLLFPPLLLIGIPLTIYSTWPIIQRAYKALFYEGQAKLKVVGSVIIMGSLAANYYTTASLLQWLYFLNRKLMFELNHKYRQILSFILQGGSRWVWVLTDGVEIQMSRQEVKAGDVIVVNEDETIPFDGVITEGRAVIDLYPLTGESQPVEREVGDRVFASTGVRSGYIFVKVDRT